MIYYLYLYVMKTTFIYALADPRDLTKIRYVGKANNPSNRYCCHTTKFDNKDQYNTHKNNWIRSLAKENLKPVLIILDEVDREGWEKWELHYFNLYKHCDLTNVEVCIGNSGTVQKIKPSYNKETINKRIQEDPYKYRCKPILKIDIKTNEVVARYASAKCVCEAENIKTERLRCAIAGFKRIKGKEIKVNHIRGYKYIHE